MQQDLSSLLKMELNSKNSSIFGAWEAQWPKNCMAAHSLVLLTNVKPWYLELNKIQCSHSLPYGFSFFLTM